MMIARYADYVFPGLIVIVVFAVMVLLVLFAVNQPRRHGGGEQLMLARIW